MYELIYSFHGLCNNTVSINNTEADHLPPSISKVKNIVKFHLCAFC